MILKLDVVKIVAYDIIDLTTAAAAYKNPAAALVYLHIYAALTLILC